MGDEPKKPTCEADVYPPFDRIGEPGWADRVKGLLTSYGVPLPTLPQEGDLAKREAELGLTLPASLGSLLLEIGPLDLEIRLLRPDEIRLLDDVWFRDRLPAEQQALLPQLLAIADYGSGDFVALDLGSGGCGVLSHDPAGLWKPLPDIDMLFKIILMRLPAGYYGWPDEDVSSVVDAAISELAGFSF